MSFDEASHLCSCLDSALPIFSAEEGFSLEKLSLNAPLKAPGLYEKIWIGYTDREEEGVWKDKNGEELELLDRWGEWDGEKLPDNAVWCKFKFNEPLLVLNCENTTFILTARSLKYS